MLTRIIIGVVVAVAVTLLCYLLGDILGALKVNIAIQVGDFLKTYGSGIGILAGLWYAVVYPRRPLA